MSKKPMRPMRSSSKGLNPDLGAIDSYKFNEAAGGDKVLIIKPAIEKATIANEIVGAGRLVMISAAGPYDLKCLGRAYDSAKVYNVSDIAVSGGKVYMCSEDNVTGAFDTTKWIAKADAVISGIPASAGDVIPTGRWHNAISLAGFLVQDDTSVSWASQRR